jgi:DUF4097 and DUF4098 domain-containing protein YvlB
MRRETFDAPGALRMLVKLGSGEIDLESTDDRTTEVRIEGPHEDDFRVEFNQRGDRAELIVESPKRFGLPSMKGHQITIRAPHGADLEVKSGSADVEARGRYGEVDLTTGSGNVVLDHAAALAVKSGSGDVEVKDVEREASFTSGSGDIEAARLGGRGTFRSGPGDISIGDAESDLSIVTASGDQTIRSASAGRLKLRAASGDVHVGIRQGSRVFVDARSAAGDMVSELELGDEAPAGDGPLVEVDATTASGDVRIVRA